MPVPRLTPLALLLCALTVCLSASPTAAAASAFSVSNPLQLAGRRTEPASASAITQTLRQQAGVDPSQVTAQNSCTAATPGHATCDAQVLVLKSTHRALHPREPGHGTRAQLGLAGAAVPATGPAGQAAPVANTPQFLQQAYDLTYLSAEAGAGDTVAIVDAYDDPNAESDLATYRSRYGLGQCTTANGCFRKVNETGQSSPLPSHDLGWEEEESLDLDAVSALCPNCHILLVEATSNGLGDMQAAAQTADNLHANQISMSFTGEGSGDPGIGPWAFSGVSSLAATGDHGYAGGIDNGCRSSPPSLQCNNYPAADAGVTAVGGTTLTAGQSLRGFGESAWTLAPGSGGKNWGGGSGCDTNQAKPAYQTDSGCTGRSYSDLAADADPSTGLIVYDSGNGGLLLMGGTSLATPLTAAYEAVTGVAGTTPAWAYSDSGLLNDVASGTNGSCALSIAYICTAGTGYDGPTGNGSISGDVTTGGPGFGATSATTVLPGDANVSGAIYPNGLDTTYYWEYGTTTSYGHRTASVDRGAGTAPLSAQGVLTNLAAQTKYHYRLVATNGVATTYGYDYTFTTPSGNPPVERTAPSVQGTPQSGQTLTLTPGTWNPSGTMTYQWQHAAAGSSTFTDIAGATAATYSPDASLIGEELEAVLTVTNSDGIWIVTLPAGTIEASSAPVNDVLPSVGGPVRQGSPATANLGTWGPVGTVAYQWQEAGTSNGSFADIGGATSAQYTPTNGDVGQFLRVEVTETDGIGPTTATSAAAGPVGAPLPVNLTAPSISGTPAQGQTLTAQPGLWGPTGTISYQWQRYGYDWQDIPGSTGASYTLTASDAQTEVRVAVTETSTGGSAQAFSNATGTVSPLAPTPSPAAPSIPAAPPASPSISPAPAGPPSSGSAGGASVSGRAAVGSQVKVSLDAGTGTVRSVQFFRCAQRCAPASTPGSNAYRLGTADQGYYIRAQVRLSNGATVWSTRMIGPVSSPTAGAATLARASGHVTVVRALGGGALVVAHVVRVTARTLALNVAAQGTGPVAVWACLVRQGVPASCTAARTARGRLELTLPLVKGYSVQLVAVRRR